MLGWAWLGWNSACLACTTPWVCSLAPHNWHRADNCNPSTQGMETWGQGTQGYPGLHGEFKVSLDCMKPCLKKPKTKILGCAGHSSLSSIKELSTCDRQLWWFRNRCRAQDSDLASLSSQARSVSPTPVSHVVLKTALSSRDVANLFLMLRLWDACIL